LKRLGVLVENPGYSEESYILVDTLTELLKQRRWPTALRAARPSAAVYPQSLKLVKFNDGAGNGDGIAASQNLNRFFI
jgi:hypothetical protein